MQSPSRTPVPPIATLTVEGERVTIIDQTLLPGEERRIELATVDDVWEAIQQLKIRGAPAIGIAAAFGLAVAARNSEASDRSDLLSDVKAARKYLATSRPTAVNLFWALDRVLDTVEQSRATDVEELRGIVWAEARALLAEDLEVCRKIGKLGAALIGDAGAVLTHCNAGGLATSGYGTALASIYVAHEQGTRLHVYVDETRPLLQGSRLTSWELARAGVDATVIADNMAATVLSRGDVRAVIVGADRVAANGDVANKVGTYGVAILARTFGIPFYVAVPLSTIDFALANGAKIPIEEREPDELTTFNQRIVTPPGVRVFNPAFDVTPAEYVTAFITEHGIVEPPFAGRLAELKGSAN
jgi:methylthioribose-1-phosphate isomerase